MVSYEQMLADAVDVMTQVAKHFQLDSSKETVQTIVENHSFKRLSAGRERGQQDTKSFFRSGVAGDWKKHFTPEVTKKFKSVAGRFLVEFGYESDLLW